MSSQTTGANPEECRLLAAARRGDERAFARLVDPRRAELHAHCYRMLGSVHDAEDALQDTMLRAWRGLGRFEGRSSARSWLYRIATNACIDVAGRRPSRVLPIDLIPPAALHDAPGSALAESVWLEPYPDADTAAHDGRAAPEARYELRETLELAFVAALQHLSPQNRAVLILREVLGFSAAEVAELLETSPASVNSALQRARRDVEQRIPAESQQSTLRALGDEEVRALVTRYADALERADTGAVLELLVEGASWSMPPMSTWYLGHETIAAFLTDHALSQRWRHLPTRANGQVAVGCYMWDERRGSFVAAVLDVLSIREGKIAAVTAFVDSSVLLDFGLPAELSA